MLEHEGSNEQSLKSTINKAFRNKLKKSILGLPTVLEKDEGDLWLNRGTMYEGKSRQNAKISSANMHNSVYRE